MTSNSSEPATFGTVCVVGLGYIGLPTAAFIASGGSRVVGVDVNSNYVERINRGEVPFYEPGFGDLLKKVVSEGKLSAQTETPAADAYIVAVPTPFAENYEVDTTFIRAAGEKIAAQLKGGELIVLESTSPPGTTEKLADMILAERPDLTLENGQSNTVYFAHAPERVLPGKIMQEMTDNDRIIGGVGSHAGDMARDLYATFCNGELLITDAKTAEMAKLTENSFRDVNIAFANELSIISERLGIDVWELIELANHHPRVNILQPGPGVGGHCIAVDPWFIVSAAPEEARLIRTAREVNDGKPTHVLDKVEALASRFKSPVIAALGIAFKANIDDLRESPSLNIVDELATRIKDSDVRVVEPNVEELPEQLARHRNIRKQGTEDAIRDADIVLLLVDHDEFKRVDPEMLQEKVIVDTKGVWR